MILRLIAYLMMFAAYVCTRREASRRVKELEQQLANSIDRELLTYEIHRLMMPDGYKGRERDQARFWNGALKSIESFVRSH